MKECYVSARGLSRRAGVLAVAVVSLACLAVVSSAFAAEPTGDFSIFKQCPRSSPGVNFCLESQISSGETTLDKLSVPIVNPVTIQFGLIKEEVPPFGEKIVGALNGETLSPTPEPVPGGLSSLIDCGEIQGRFPKNIWRGACRAAFESPSVTSNPYLTAVNETTELAGPASEMQIDEHNVEAKEGIALAIPVKIHLENPLLGRECYIGSNNNPITVEFTVGTTSPPPPNEPITGKAGFATLKDNYEFIENYDHTDVDNAFAVPAATGCGGQFAHLVNPLVNKKVGLPAPAGYNTLIHEGYADEALTTAVVASEQPSEPNNNEHEPGSNEQTVHHHDHGQADQARTARMGRRALATPMRPHPRPTES